MLKGVNRSVLVVRTGKNSNFEAVYFMLRRGNTAEPQDIVREANKIIKQGERPRPRALRICPTPLLIGVGAIGGGLLTALVWLVSALVS